MRLPMYQVDAFTDSLFGGNPAAVCPLDAWLPDATMQAIAAENNLAETAFFVRDGSDYALRWFTPTVEVDLCGHATLASGHVVFSFLEPKRDSVGFHTAKAGTLTVGRQGDRLVMDFPAWPAEPCEPPAGLLAALGIHDRDMRAFPRQSAANALSEPSVAAGHQCDRTSEVHRLLPCAGCSVLPEAGSRQVIGCAQKRAPPALISGSAARAAGGR